MLNLKACWGADIRRISVADDITMKDLHALLRSMFALPDEYVLQYTDDEGDQVTVMCDSELDEALRQAHSLTPPMLRVRVVHKRDSSERAPCGVAPSGDDMGRWVAQAAPLWHSLLRTFEHGLHACADACDGTAVRPAACPMLSRHLVEKQRMQQALWESSRAEQARHEMHARKMAAAHVRSKMAARDASSEDVRDQLERGSRAAHQAARVARERARERTGQEKAMDVARVVSAALREGKTRLRKVALASSSSSSPMPPAMRVAKAAARAARVREQERYAQAAARAVHQRDLSRAARAAAGEARRREQEYAAGQAAAATSKAETVARAVQERLMGHAHGEGFLREAALAALRQGGPHDEVVANLVTLLERLNGVSVEDEDDYSSSDDEGSVLSMGVDEEEEEEGAVSTHSDSDGNVLIDVSVPVPSAPPTPPALPPHRRRRRCASFTATSSSSSSSSAPPPLPPPPYHDELEKLQRMGFGNTPFNLQLLERYDGRIGAVVEHLLGE